MRARSTSQVHHDTRDILGPSEPLHRVRRGDALLATAHIQQPVAHLGREEPGADAIDGNMPRAQLHRQVSSQMNNRRLGRTVPIRPLLTNGPNAQPGHRRSDDHPARLLERSPLLQEGRKLADGVEHAPHVQVHDLGEGRVRVLVEGGAPGGARVGEQDVDVVGVLADFGHEVLHAGDGGGVGGDGDGARAGGQAGQGVEGLDGRVAGRGFAGGDEDFGGARLEETFGSRGFVSLR